MRKLTRWPLYCAALIAVLFGIPIPEPRQPDATSQKVALVTVQGLANALSVFHLDVGRYPSTAEGLRALVDDPGLGYWAGPYLRKGLPQDPWGRPYRYRVTAENGFDVWSWGSDGKPGGRGEATDIHVAP
ncbi:MAG: type II secretion system protein GspG [Acidobacteria bacterium]|nr:MAG: type II secretion system protein GspG [Acidobacteriota bacterium]